MDYSTRLNKEVKAYHGRGLVVLPVPEGQKHAPPTGTTGNKPTMTDDEIRALWEGVSGSSNLAWRLPDNVIGLDVDHGYNGKTGADTLKALEEDLGELPPTWSTTRRGADSKSRKMFYIVPEGFKWHAKAGADIDIIQRSHRYVIVAPSDVDGLAEQWYRPDGTPSDRAPLIEELAGLPEKWIEHLKKETFSPQNAPSEDLSWPDADVWLSKVAPGWEAEPGPIFRSILEDEELFSGGRHDVMVSEQKHFLRLAVVNGETGLKKALTELARLFIEAVSDRDPEESAGWEFESALYGEVDNLRGDIEHDKAVPFLVKASPVVVEGLTSLTGAADAAEALEETVKAIEYIMANEIGDNEPAAIMQWWNDSLIVVRGRDVRGRDSSDLYDTATGRFVDTSTLMSICEDVAPILQHMREVAQAEANTAESENEQNRALNRVTALNALLRYFSVRRSVENMQTPLKGKLVREGRVKEESEFDKDPWVLLLSDGLILDLRKANKPGAALAGCIRPRDRRDLLTPARMLGVSGADIERYAGSSREIADLYEIIFPDPAVREQVYRAQAYSLLGENSHRLLWGLIGEPGTGKGTATKAYTGVLGSYTVPTALSALMDTGGNNTKLATALKSRVATMSEFSPETKGDVAMLKAISGDDIIQVADKYKAAEEVRSGTTLFFETNHAPNLEADKAFRDRLMVVPMEGDRPALEEWLSAHSEWHRDKANLVGHLETLIEYFHHAYRHGFKDESLPPKMVEAADKFVADGDPLSEWIEDNFVFDPEARLLSKTLVQRVQVAIAQGDLPKEITALKARKRLEHAGAAYSGSNKFTVAGERGRGLYGVKYAPTLGIAPALAVVEDESA